MDFYQKAVEMKNDGIELHLLLGNHDYWVQEFITEELMDQVYFDDAILEVDGKKLFITHGDGLLSWDHGYRILKRIIRSKFFIWLFRWVHPTIAYRLANAISKSGRHHTHSNDFNKDVRIELQNVAKNHFDNGFDFMICGHYHLGEIDDPDNVEKNLVWLHEAKIPNFVKYTVVYLLAFTWKFTYYAPNTLRILENKERARRKEEPTLDYELSPFTKNGFELWKQYLLPYGLFQFVLLPSLFYFIGGIDAVLSAFIFILIAEAFANLHAFLVIVPNHSAEDIYQFSTPHKTQGEYYLRQIMGSVNYNTGNDLIDFGHGFLNYQIEHHLFPICHLAFTKKCNQS
jgi:predicted phosphodiesterase